MSLFNQLTKNIMGAEVDRQVDPEVREVPASSIAVLPFEDISPAGDQAYFGNGIADELRLELQRLDGLSVAGRTSSVASAQEDGKTIGETLNVDSILEGSIPTRLAAVWYPVMSDLRQLAGFKKLVTELNLVEYWPAYGWADACRPLGEEDFECS